MRTLVASLLACATADETSLMQDRVKHSASTKLSTYGDSSTKASRHDSTSRLLETAVKMIKNGVTPDVITFVDATTAEIEELTADGWQSGVFVPDDRGPIQNEHDQDQLYIDELCARFTTAVARLESDSDEMNECKDAREVASEEHHTCRSQEAYACARSRRCEEQLRKLWLRVKVAEEEMREIHWEIHDEWCVHKPDDPSIQDCANYPPYINSLPSNSPDTGHVLSHCFNWEDMSPYPTLSLPRDVIDFRHWSVTHFHEYSVKKIAVEEAWRVYNLKLEECADFEAALDAKVPHCDELQLLMRTNTCNCAEKNKEARERFGQEWASIISSYNLARQEKDILQMDRIAEFETLKIVQCLLNHVHSSVETSIHDNLPCPTIDSDPDGVTMTISECHVVTRGCRYAWNHTFDRGDEFQSNGTGYDRGNGIHGSGVTYSDDLLQHTDENGNTGTWPINAGSLTAHLCLEWCPIPEVPPLPSPLPPACTPRYIAREQGSFLADVQHDFTTALFAADSDYPNEPLSEHLTTLSAAGWAGCAAPLVCIDCPGASADLPVYSEEDATECHVHQDYLEFGQSDASTFRCSDGDCLSMSGRCNGYAQCKDGSDEQGCNTEYGTPAYLGTAHTEPEDWHADVYFRCANSLFIDRVGLCNGFDNCGDNSDESHCSGAFTVVSSAELSSGQLSVESTSGREITVETLQSNTGAFQDRDYAFESLGSFQGKTFIHYSNDDKLTEDTRVMTKIRTTAPTSVFIVKLPTHNLPWLEGQGYTQVSRSGVSFKGQREINRGDVATEWESTRHKEWANGINNAPGPNINTEDQYDLSSVWSKTFPAGLISIPGNDGGDGSFLIFLERPSETPLYNYGAMFTNTCPTSGVSEANCLAAVQSLLGSGQMQGRTGLVAGSWGWVPPGCSVQSHFTHNQDGDFAAHYNRNSAGQNDGGYTPVCATQCQHLHDEDVVAGEFQHYGADHANSNTDEACSASCTASAECTAWVRQPSTGSCWLSSQAVVRFEADSDRTAGLRCN